MQKAFNITRAWLPLAAAQVAFAVLVYGAVQFNFRSGANDPQVQMAEDSAHALAQGTQPEDLIPGGTVDMAASLAPYLIFYSKEGHLTATNVTLHGQPPTLPDGVLEAARQNGGSRITWQPEPGVRSAIVIMPVAGDEGFALAGRSLREVEDRISQLTLLLEVGLAASLLGTLVLTVLINLLLAGRQEQTQ